MIHDCAHRIRVAVLSCCALAGVVLDTSTTAAAVIVYVDDDAPPGGDGLTWDAGFRFLQDALDYANQWQNGVTEIRIAQGVYKPDHDVTHPNGSEDPGEYFYPPPGIPVFGGYAGVNAPDPGARDIDQYETILSGDLAGNDEPGFVNREDNSYSVVDCEEAIVDGCTITSGGRGFASDGLTITRSHLRENYCAIRGAMDGSGMHVSQCVFDHNAVGIIIDLDGATVEDCVFSNHSTWTIMGGESGLVANRCTFTNNSGGAWFVESWPHFRDCEFIGNSGEFGGAAYFGPDSADGSSGEFLNCTFRDNNAAKGGAVYSKGYPSRHNALLFRNCVFFENEATVSGGAIASLWSNATLTNCTLVKNSAESGGGVYSASSSSLKVRNSIIRQNSGGPFSGAGTQNVTFSDVTGGHSGEGNINKAPKFVDILAGDLHLKLSSPCIDAGKKASVPSDLVTDLDGNPRCVNVPGVPNTGLGNPPVDMGAYEYQP